MTREQADALAHVCAELTDNLPLKFERIGAALTKAMLRANRPGCQLDGGIAVGRVHGILDALTIMGVPHKVIRQGKYGDYMGVEIAGETFHVDSASSVGGQEGA